MRRAKPPAKTDRRMAAASLVVLTEYKFCANCAVFGWKQVEPEKLKHCKKCKVLSYCSVSCQHEHWALVHKQQCQELASIGKCGKPVDAFKLLDDIGPLQDLVVQADKIILKMFMEVRKSRMSKSAYTTVSNKLDKLRNTMLVWRKMILVNKTTYPKRSNYNLDTNIVMQMSSILHKDDLHTELWSSLQLVLGRLHLYVNFDMAVKRLKTPRESVPAEHWVGFEQEIGLLPERVADLINALSSVSADQIPSFQELLRIFCGGTLSQTCSFCDQSMTVAAVIGEVRGKCTGIPTVDILPFLPPLFICGAKPCHAQWLEKIRAVCGLEAGLQAACSRLSSSRCDFCFMMAEKVHR